MTKYKHLSSEERSLIGHYRIRKFSLREIARLIQRNVSTISREVRRNRYPDGKYIARHAGSYYRGRRSRSRSGTNFKAQDWQLVIKLLKKQFSPDQISGRLKLESTLSISHETIYKYIWNEIGGEKAESSGLLTRIILVLE